MSPGRAGQELIEPLVINEWGLAEKSDWVPPHPQLFLASFKLRTCSQWSGALFSQADKWHRIIMAYAEGLLICLFSERKGSGSYEIASPSFRLHRLAARKSLAQCFESLEEETPEKPTNSPRLIPKILDIFKTDL